MNFGAAIAKPIPKMMPPVIFDNFPSSVAIAIAPKTIAITPTIHTHGPNKKPRSYIKHPEAL